jgi:hypothetical protein
MGFFLPGEFLPNFDLKIKISYSRLVQRIIFHEEKKNDPNLPDFEGKKNFKKKIPNHQSLFMITSSK